jgi:hypothetical protein
MNGFSNAGNGVFPSHSLCRRGADPHQNESGTAGAHSFKMFDPRRREVSAGKGSRVMATNRPDSELGTSQRSISHTRSRCSREAMMVSTPFAGNKGSLRYRVMIGNVVGQMFTSLVFVQRSRKFGWYV